MTNQTTKNDPNNRGRDELEQQLRISWLGMRDSNPRIPVPKTGALPLGQAPIFKLRLALCKLFAKLKPETRQSQDNR